MNTEPFEAMDADAAQSELADIEHKITEAGKAARAKSFPPLDAQPGQIVADCRGLAYKIKGITPKRKAVMAWRIGLNGEPYGNATRLNDEPYLVPGTKDDFDRAIRRAELRGMLQAIESGAMLE